LVLLSVNPGGSVKDRIGRRMVLDAEARGEIKPGDVLIEPTSGNTGVGLSMTAAVKGYKMIITMPEKMSQEKQDALKGLGATIVRTPTENGFDHAESHIGLAFEMQQQINDEHAKDPSKPRAKVLDQYKNPGNPMAHYEETGQEIWDQTDGKIDYLIAGAGTGGTITGIARKLKELAAKHNRTVTVVGVDPNGSILATPESMNSDPQWNPDPNWGQQTEGIGYDFIPRVDQQQGGLVDEWLKGPDKQSFVMARDLMKLEGFMCGGSSGTAMDGAIRYIEAHGGLPGKTVVVVMPDNIRNYMTKHLNDDWMYERGYITEQDCASRAVSDLIPNADWGQDQTVNDLPLKPAHFLTIDVTCKDAIELMRTRNFDQFPVKDLDGSVYGVVTASNLLNRLGKNQLKLKDSIKRACIRDLRHVSKSTTLNELIRVLKRNSFVLVEQQHLITFSDVFDVMHPEPVSRKELQELKSQMTTNTTYGVLAGLALGVVTAFAVKRWL